MSVDASASAPDSGEIPIREQSALQRADEVANRAVSFVERAVRDLWYFARFFLFAIYLVLGIVSVWLWMLSAVLGVLRFGLRAVMLVLLWLSGGIAPRPGVPGEALTHSMRRDLDHLWAQRLTAYEAVARPLARHLVAAKAATRTFWHWSMARKSFALLLAVVFIGLPLLYVIPRPHYVQVTDDNAVHYEEDGQKVYYLVHSVDLFNRDHTREYINEDAPYLGKINSQGVKSQIVPGRYYRFWVVGIRWYKFPRLFPNIIRAVEVDAEGNTVSNPSRHLPIAIPAQSQDIAR